MWTANALNVPRNHKRKWKQFYKKCGTPRTQYKKDSINSNKLNKLLLLSSIVSVQKAKTSEENIIYFIAPVSFLI